MKRQRQPAQCWCGHDRDAHTHYRSGTECALCTCQRWAPPRWWRLRLFRLGRESLLDRAHSRLPCLAPACRAEYLPAATAMSVNLRPGRCVPLVREGAATWVMKEASRNLVSGHEPLMRLQLSLACTGRGEPNPSRQIRTYRARNSRSVPGPTCVPAWVRPASRSPSRGRIRSAIRSRRRTRHPPRTRTRRRPAARSAGGTPTATLPTTGIQPGRARTRLRPATLRRRRMASGCRCVSSPPPGPRRPGSSHPASSRFGSSHPETRCFASTHHGSSQPRSRCFGSRPGSRCFASSQPGRSRPGSSRLGSTHPGSSRFGSGQPGSRCFASRRPGSRCFGSSQSGRSRPGSIRFGSSQPGSNQSRISRFGGSRLRR